MSAINYKNDVNIKLILNSVYITCFCVDGSDNIIAVTTALIESVRMKLV